MAQWPVHTPLFSWVLLIFLCTPQSEVHSLSQPVVRVCQNKHCKKRFANLKESISELLPAAEVKSSGCLSHCNDGPNIELETTEGHITVLNGIQDVTTAAILLEQSLETTIPKILHAASKLMEQVPSLDPANGLKYLNSVISKLEQSEYLASAAMARALVMRADLHFQLGEARKALDDAQQVLKLKQVATSETLAIAYRICVDTEENKLRVVAILQQWYKDLPKFRTKLQKEIQLILETLEEDRISSCPPEILL